MSDAGNNPSRRTIALGELAPGLRLPGPIYDARQPTLLLLREGAVLSAGVLRLLRERGVREVSISNEVYNQIFGKPAAETSAGTNSTSLQRSTFPASRPVVVAPPQRLWVEALFERNKLLERRQSECQQVEGALEQLRKGNPTSICRLTAVVDHSLQQILADIDLYVSLNLLPGKPEEHSLRASQLAIAAGAELKLTQTDLNSVGLGLLLSRVGVTTQTQQVTRREHQLSNIERLELLKVPSRTFEYLEQLPDLPPAARQVACQLFERNDGSGYPRGRAGSQIHALARLGAVCDVFVALVTDRPHRPAFSHTKAISVLLDEARAGKFDPQAVKALLQTICLYPMGTLLKFSDGRYGRVLKNHRDQYDRPIVELMADPQSAHGTGATMDLRSNSAISILEVVNLQQWIARQQQEQLAELAAAFD